MKSFLRILSILALVAVATGAVILWAPVSALEAPRLALREWLHLGSDAAPGATPKPAKEVASDKTAPAEKAVAAPVTPSFPPARWHALPEEQARLVEALKRLAAIRADGGVKNTRKLFVTYICTADREPYPDYRARLDRAVKDVRDYYASEMTANGLPPITFDIETEADGLLKLHMGKIAEPLSALDKHANAGTLTKAASDKVLREAGIDPKNNHVLIICQIPDGVSPYYGSGGNGDGVCWICDLPGFDPVNLASKLSKEETFKLAKNPEELAIFRNRALGDHTTTYMGGTAHELGHCFNLPHTGDSPEQAAMWGSSLMGAGNYTYGNERRGAGKGAFLNPTDALRLIGQPLFAHVDYRVRDRAKAEFGELQAVPERDGTRISGRILSTTVPVYAVLVTYLFDYPGGDYPSNAVSSLVDPKTGEFSAFITRDHNGPVDIMVTALHANGMHSDLHTSTTGRGRWLDTGRLNLEWSFAPVAQRAQNRDFEGARAELETIRKSGKKRELFADRIAAWDRALSAPAKPSVVAATASGSSVSLADCATVSETSGYGLMPPSRDRIPVEGSRKGGLLPGLGDRSPKRSLFTHAPGDFVYDLGGAWKKFTGYYGMARGGFGPVTLVVIGDGRQLYSGESPAARRGRKGDLPHDFEVDVTGVKKLEIRIAPVAGLGGAWGLIGEPTLSR